MDFFFFVLLRPPRYKRALLRLGAGQFARGPVGGEDAGDGRGHLCGQGESRQGLDDFMEHPVVNHG